jgi:TatD DNase family protein
VIDFHCHLDLYPDPELAAEDAHIAGIYVLSVTTTPKAWRRTSALARGRPRIRTALGIHPEIAHERLSELPLFEALAPETRYFGELGLDGSPQYAQFAGEQLKVFEFALGVAARLGGRIITIHSRRAADQVLECLRRQPSAGTPILHWFSGTAAQLRRAIDVGCWFSVGPAMLRSASGRAIASNLPKDRVLTETDGPFAKDRSLPLQPADSWKAVDGLASVWGMPRGDVVHRLRENLRSLAATTGADADRPHPASPT